MTLGLATREMPGGAAQAPKALCCQVLWNSPPAAGDALGQALSGLAGQVPALKVTLVLCFHLPRKMCCVLGWVFCPDLHLSRFCFSFLFNYDFLHNSEKKAQKQFGRKEREKSLAETCTSRPKNRCLTLKIAPFMSPDTQGCE